MELINDFEVAVPIGDAWSILTDLERIAPCLPGAQLREVEGEEYRGVVKVKVGPITASYDGAIRFVERDETAHRMVLKAEGRETRGQGNVAALITATMSPTGEGTSVAVVTDLTISGKVAQFGRGVLADVSAKLLDQFVVNLETSVLNDVDGDSTGDVEESDGSETDDVTGISAEPVKEDGLSDSIRHIHFEPVEPVEPVDILEMAGGSLARRAVKPLLIGLAAVVALRFARHRRQ